MRATLVAFLILFCRGALFSATESLVPAPRLRPSDPARFYGGSVKMAGNHLQDLQTIVASNLNRADIAERLVDHKALRKAASDAPFLAALLPHASGNVQEWALKSLGEARGDKVAAVPYLLRLAADESQSEAVRALAVRVISTIPMDPGSVEKLANLITLAPRDLRLLLLETIPVEVGGSESALGRIQAGLHELDAAIQFYSFRALEKVEAAAPLAVIASASYRRAQALKAPWRSAPFTPSARASLIQILRDRSAPDLHVALALLAIAEHRLTDDDVLDAILAHTAAADAFIAELAGNVCESFDSLPRGSVPVLTRSLTHTNAVVRTRAAAMFAKTLPDTSVLPAVVRALERKCAPRELAAFCDILRSLGTNAVSASRALAAFLPEETEIYRGLRKHEVYELRAYILVTLAEITVPPEAMPFILDGLANTEEEMPHLFAAAARAAGALGPAAKDAVPFLLRALEGTIKDTFISFSGFGEHSAVRDYTTCQIEALRALARIGRPASAARPAVEAFLRRELPDLDHPNRIQRAPDLHVEARAALNAIGEAP